MRRKNDCLWLQENDDMEPQKKSKIRRIAKAVCVIGTIVLACLLVFSAYSGKVDPHTSAIFPLITLTFPYLLGLTVVVAILWLILLRWRVALIPIVAIALSWPMVRIVCPLNIPQHKITAKEDSTKFTVLTYNVMSFEKNTHWDHHDGERTLKYILDSDADVVMIQEGSLSVDYNNLPMLKPHLNMFKKRYPYRSHGYHDQVILSKHPYTVVEDSTIKEGFASPDDPLSMYHFYARGYDVLVPGHTVRFINLHLSSMMFTHEDKKAYMDLTDLKDQPKRSEISTIRHSLLSKLSVAFRKHAVEARIIRHVIDQSGENVIVCGDFNEVPGSYTYRTIKGNDMRDAYSDCAFGLANTFRDNRFYFKIDHILYRGDMKAVRCRVDKEGDSDHYPQIATFVWKN